uniref:DUF753 domain-containing protein n=1 Tax=Glossina brevipalpis TaxID=37001 RepID=A0A1A9WZI1_9MUSC
MPTFPINFFIIFLIFFKITASFQAESNEQEKLSCYHCTSTEDNIDCNSDLTQFKPKLCEKYQDVCYIKVGMTGNVIRGCVANYAIGNCEAPSCFTCNFDGCNDHNTCKSCSINNDTCSRTDVSDKKFDEICESSQTQCLVKVADGGKVERRCAQESDYCFNNKTCKLCSGPLCNGGIFPEDRLSCFQCNGTDCKYSFQPLTQGSYCSNYVENDKCYVYGDNESSMQRGCVSDDMNPCAMGNQNTAKCLICDKNHDCNNRPYKSPQILKCIECESTKENIHCLNSQDQSLAKSCSKKDLLYTDEELCYTHLKNSSAKRGCLYDHMANKDECKEEDGCEKCSGMNGCNNKEITINFSCIVCRSDTNKKCRNDAKHLRGTSCRTDVGWNKGCFYGIWNDIVIRGCYVDAHEQMQYICSDKNNSQCHVCETSDCNISVVSKANELNLSINLQLKYFLSLFVLKFYFIQMF